MDIRKFIYSRYNFFIGILAFMLVWMLFFDTNDILTQFELKSKRNELRERKKFYEDKIKQVRADREALFTDKRLLEEFAREKYLMKKPKEEVFVIVED